MESKEIPEPFHVTNASNPKSRGKVDKAEMFANKFESKFLTNPVLDELLELSSNDYEDSVPLARLEEVAEQKRTNLALRKL